MTLAAIGALPRLVGRAFFAAALAAPAWAMSVDATTSVLPPVPVGSTVRWSAQPVDPDPGAIWYRYRIRMPQTSVFRLMRDFSPDASLDWTPSEQEGTYEFEISARNRDTGETAVTWAFFAISSRVTSEDPVITNTGNELVFLYSAPPCPSGGSMRVQFTDSDGFSQSTPERSCANGRSMNVYLAGLKQDTQYAVQHSVSRRGETTKGPILTLRTPVLRYPAAVTRLKESRGDPTSQGVLLQSRVFEYHVATDTSGNVIWYCPFEIRYLTRAEPGGFFYALIEDGAGDDTKQLLRIIDLAGNVVRETNAGYINDQLAAMGKRRITSFHHEARSMPEGRTLVLAGTEQIMSDVQGPGEVDIVGDMILVLNRNFKVEWAWDAFDHLDVRRAALLDEKCTPATGGCPVTRLAPIANDWLHGNSLQLTPDGHILYSARHQDWIIKIDYGNGRGSGNVLWRLGKDGDFRALSEEPWPWFSHQHDANFEAEAETGRLSVFDNGNTRYSTNSSAHSRGQVLEVNEAERTVRWALDVDLGSYSRALGSAQKLANGNYHFELGWRPDGYSEALEYTPSGELVLGLEKETPVYRSFRMQDMYTP